MMGAGGWELPSATPAERVMGAERVELRELRESDGRAGAERE